MTGAVDQWNSGPQAGVLLYGSIMPKPGGQEAEIPLPPGWDFCRDFDNKLYFIDHNTQKTTWIDPRDR